MADPQFLLAMSVNPHRNGGFSRAGLRFSRAWRALQLGDADDLAKDPPVIGPETAARIKAEKFLAVRAASPDEVASILADQAKAPADKDAELADLRAKNADLEARLLRLELVAAGGKGDAKGGGKAKDEQPKG
jgi:hypothetical protein